MVAKAPINPNPPGRPKKLLVEQVQKTLTDALRLGVPINIACQAAGIAQSSFYGWMQRGLGEQQHRELNPDDPDPEEDEYLDLYLKVTAARAEAAVRNVGVIQKVAQGGTVTETTKEYMPDGTMKETVKKQPPDWRAAAWYLERSHRGEYQKGAEQLEISGPGGGPVQMQEGTAGALSARLSEFLAAGVTERPEQHAITTGHDPDDDDEPVDAEIVEDGPEVHG